MKILILIVLISQSFAQSPLQLREESDPHATSNFEGFKKIFRVPEPRFRLFHSIIPTNYNLKLRPILDNLPDIGAQWSAPGTVIISVDCQEQTNNITLHSGVTSINETSIKITAQSNGVDLPNLRFSRDLEKEFFIITSDTPLVVGEKYKITIDFVAEIFTGPNQLSGLYRSHYVEPSSGDVKYVATTQLQAFGARLVFPSFDEPEFKATFDISLGYLASKYSATCNTPINKIQIDPDHSDWRYAIFDTTVPMPTYLVAIIISDFGAATADPSIYNPDKPVQTIGPKYQIDAGLGNYTAMVAAQTLAHFEEYFVEEYSLAKMDSAAMVDFAAGAMENWGLNIYREAYLMYSREENTENERRGMASVIAHELAHQWFGNLITCKWWIDAWVNEGFASYIQYIGMRNTTPEFEPFKDRLPREFQNAMRSDVLPGSHPTRLPDKGSPYETMNYLSALVYSKGSALIRMMEQFLTEKTLQAGLQKFLKTYSFKPVDQDELFEVLNEQAHEDGMLPDDLTIKAIMDTWTLQRGYPLMYVSKAGSSRIYISQEKFINKGDPEESLQWYIPVAVATADNPDFSNGLPAFWIDPLTILTSKAYDTTKWIILNAGATGYYRVIYDQPLTTLIQEQLENNHLAIGEGSRSQLFDDYFTAAFQGYVGIKPAMDFTLYLDKELDYTVWTPVLFHLRKLYNLYTGNEFNTFKNYMTAKLDPVMDQIGVEQPPQQNGSAVLFRAQLMDWYCGFGSPKCMEYALRRWEEWKTNPAVNNFPIDLRSILYCAAIRGSNSQEDIDFAVARSMDAGLSSKQRQWIIGSLGCAPATHLLEPLLARAISPTSNIQKTDVLTLFRSIASNVLGRGILMDFLQDNIDDIITYMGSPNLISDVISTLSNYYSIEGDHQRIKSFVDANPEHLQPVQASLNASLTNIESNIRFIEDYSEELQMWFWANRNSV